ncbi:Transketolase [bioreactor metagenome]|uniref:Transketolase n=1 Tax=bioreactor metagenome TaxID=1076179 RepID=A0A645GY86_9ZZZZ
MLAGKYQLDNLVAVIDNNRLEFDGKTEDVMPVKPFKEKWESFGWNVEYVDGHDVDELFTAFEKANNVKKKPTVIVAYTIKGKGISYMEDVVEWHAGKVNEEQYKLGMQELEM